MKALVVHSRRTGLGLIRSLGKKGVDVYTADVFKAPGFYSRFVKKGFLISRMIESGDKLFVDELMRIGQQISPDGNIFLFTASDDYLVLFAKYWHTLKTYYTATFEVDLKRLKNNLEKTKMYKIAEAANVPFPKSYYSPVDVSGIQNFPVVIKPTLKKTSNIDVVKEAFRIEFCNSEDELKSAITKLDKIDISYVVQSYIDGGDDQLYTAGIFAYKGVLVAAASARKLRQFPPVTGECSLGELVNEPKVIEYAKRYVNTSKITGVCQVEFKKFNNEFYLMEINPRPWSWNSIIEYSGVNLPYIACESISNPDEIKFHSQKKFTGTWVFTFNDLIYNVIKNKNISIITWLKNSILASKHAFWSLKDPIPAFVAIYQSIKYR